MFFGICLNIKATNFAQEAATYCQYVTTDIWWFTHSWSCQRICNRLGHLQQASRSSKSAISSVFGVWNGNVNALALICLFSTKRARSTAFIPVSMVAVLTMAFSAFRTHLSELSTKYEFSVVQNCEQLKRWQRDSEQDTYLFWLLSLLCYLV